MTEGGTSMCHIKTKRDVPVEHILDTFHHFLGRTGLMLPAPMVKPTRPELTAHEWSIRTYGREFLEFLIDIGTCTEVQRPKQIVQSIQLKRRVPIALEKYGLVETCTTHNVTDGCHIRFVNPVSAKLILYLHHDDITTVGQLEGSQLLTQFLHKDFRTLHEIRVQRTHFHIFLFEQPPRQSAHLPFRTHIRTRTQDDIHAMFLSQFTKLSHILFTGKVEFPFLLFMVVPKHIQTDGIHTKRLAHQDSVFPIGFRNACIVQLRSFYYKGVAIQQECTFTYLEGFFGSDRIHRPTHQQQKKKKNFVFHKSAFICSHNL